MTTPLASTRIAALNASASTAPGASGASPKALSASIRPRRRNRERSNEMSPKSLNPKDLLRAHLLRDEVGRHREVARELGRRAVGLVADTGGEDPLVLALDLARPAAL